MAPAKSGPPRKPTISSGVENSSVRSVVTRSSLSLMKKENFTKKDTDNFPKRKAISPAKGHTNHKRSALLNITNAIESQCIINSGKKQIKKVVTSSTTVSKSTLATKISQPVTNTTSATLIKSTISAAAKILHPVTNTTVSVTKPQLNNISKPAIPPRPKSRLTSPAKKPVLTQADPRPSVVGLNKPVAPTLPAKAVGAEKAVASKPLVKKTVLSNVPVKCTVTAKPKGTTHKDLIPNERRSSRRSTLESTDSSLYVSALSDVLDEDVTPVSTAPTVKSEPLPSPLINIDKEYQEDPFQCALYAHDIFEYLKSREDFFKVEDYMDLQTKLNKRCRAILVDWMVELQENFEMNHETLYLAVKLVDYYLSKIKVSQESVQLVGATAMLIAAKYDERIPPAIEEFLYLCNGSYKRKDMLKMELNILRVIDFQLGFPLSYRFLRRYARCAKVPMPLLTLARFILEYTLMDYSIVTLSDSKLAAAALYLAFKMKKEQEWDNTLIHFSGYRVTDFIDVAHTLNDILHQTPRQSLATVRNKYSHRVFYEVAKTPLVKNEDL